jgi:hypothetical protein
MASQHVMIVLTTMKARYVQERMWRVRATIIVTESLQYVPCVVKYNCRCQQCDKYRKTGH